MEIKVENNKIEIEQMKNKKTIKTNRHNKKTMTANKTIKTITEKTAANKSKKTT